MKRKILFIIISIFCISLSGCGDNSTKYNGFGYDEFVTDNINLSDELSSNLNSAIKGEYIEDAGELAKTAGQLEAEEREPGERSIPTAVDVSKKTDIFSNSSSVYNTVDSEYLGDKYTLTEYVGFSPQYGAWVYEYKIQDNDEKSMTKRYTEYLKKIEKEFKPKYEEQLSVGFDKVKDLYLKPYFSMYDLNDDLFLVSTGTYLSSSKTIVHYLAFINKHTKHDIDGEYSRVLVEVNNLITERKVKSFPINLYYKLIDGGSTTSNDFLKGKDGDGIPVKISDTPTPVPTIVIPTPSIPVPEEGTNVIGENVTQPEVSQDPVTIPEIEPTPSANIQPPVIGA